MASFPFGDAFRYSNGGNSRSSAHRYRCESANSSIFTGVTYHRTDSAAVFQQEIERAVEEKGRSLSTDSLHGVYLGWDPRIAASFNAERCEALPTATLHLGRAHSAGTVEEDKLADLILFEANPLQDIRNTRRIRAVVLNGHLFDREELDSLLIPEEFATQD